MIYLLPRFAFDPATSLNSVGSVRHPYTRQGVGFQRTKGLTSAFGALV